MIVLLIVSRHCCRLLQPQNSLMTRVFAA